MKHFRHDVEFSHFSTCVSETCITENPSKCNKIIGPLRFHLSRFDCVLKLAYDEASDRKMIIRTIMDVLGIEHSTIPFLMSYITHCANTPEDKIITSIKKDLFSIVQKHLVDIDSDLFFTSLNEIITSLKDNKSNRKLKRKLILCIESDDSDLDESKKK